MEDHTSTARLAVTAAFVRGMPNYATQPRRPAVSGDLTLYHALPHGLLDAMGRRVMAESFVDVTRVHATKLAALSAHRSQQSWLDRSQGMASYLRNMTAINREVGAMSGRFTLAEGWRRHNPLGFCAAAADPLHEALKTGYRRNPAYRRWLEAGVSSR
jgi:LmbE family N-acetylglucosaminyl deacetylase